MSETSTTEAQTAEQSKSTPAKSVFADLLAKTGLPAPALAPIEAKLVEAFDLIRLNNERVAAVNAAKAQDPNNAEYLDERWKSNEKTDPAIIPIAEKFYLIAEQYEKMLSQLRELGKKHIPQQLSEDAAKDTRKLVNDSAPTIAKAKASAADMALIVDQMLDLVKAKPEGGVLSLLPEVESLKNVRGRKAASAGGIPVYMTRVGEVLIDGVSTNREINGEMKGKFNFAADDLSKKFGEEVHADNAVTPEELEEAYWKAIELPFRSVKSTELPESKTFEFSKTTKVPAGNDDSFKDVPQTVKITVKRPTVKATTPATETPKPETAKPETPAVGNKETLKVSDHVRPEPTKQATPNKTPQAKK